MVGAPVWPNGVTVAAEAAFAVAAAAAAAVAVRNARLSIVSSILFAFGRERGRMLVQMFVRLVRIARGPQLSVCAVRGGKCRAGVAKGRPMQRPRWGGFASKSRPTR